MGSKKPRHESPERVQPAHERPADDEEHEDVKAAKKRAKEADGHQFDQDAEDLCRLLFGE